ncbi:PorV/PorQ family protein [candidate division KSB1 bacterium]|nr:PorV/PorQ family protein [candidate division KSB1 bacterium]
MSQKNKHLTVSVLMILLLLSFSSLQAQIRAGSAFLKMLPGVRVQSMATAHTGTLDEPHSIFANPGATGLLRDWHWAATYSKWIADIYNASFILGKRIRNPISQHTQFSLGLIYQGMPEFDSTDGAAVFVNANDLLVSFSIGQPLSIISKNISLGINLKYFKSTLDTYTANSFIFDTGILARTPRFYLGNPLFKYGILSAGLALTQLGPDLKFEQDGTPLPQTFRSGISFLMGSHHGLQLQIAGDYFKVKDEKDVFGLGVELSWGGRFSINGGYDFGSDLMSHISFGGSIRLDDTMAPEHLLIPGRNNGLRFELATVDEGEFFARTYRGGTTHLPIGPEPFDFLYPANHDTVRTHKLTLKWDNSADPDLFDNVRYSLFHTQDSAQLDDLIAIYDKNTDDFFNALSTPIDTIRQFRGFTTDSLELENIQSGHHYWAVFAEDLDSHIRFAKTGRSRISHFYVPLPDIEIEDIRFDYSPWITQDDYHGELIVTIANNGDSPASDFIIAVTDSISRLKHTISGKSASTYLTLLIKQEINVLKPRETTTIKIPWHTNSLGEHVISVQVDVEQTIEESNETNNHKTEAFYTIPKGSFTTGDTVSVFQTSRAIVDYPLVTEVCFDPFDSVVKPDYLHKTQLDPTVGTLANRLKQNRGMSISLQGFADPNSGENDVELANRRAQALRDSMINIGVKKNQITILPGEVWQTRRVPKNPQDAGWLYEERRNVTITTELANEAVLFHPLRKLDDEDSFKAAPFHLDLKHALATNIAKYFCYKNVYEDSVSITNLGSFLKFDRFDNWSPEITDSAYYVNKDIDYHFTLTDSLGRKFQTRKLDTFLNKELVNLSHKFILPMVFAKANTTQSFLWQKMLGYIKAAIPDSEKRFRFSGHACAVGPAWINERLSQQRVGSFVNEFKGYIRETAQSNAVQILTRLEVPKGYGENSPLAIERRSGEIIPLGDNNSPTGRILNRRIELEIYTK